MPVTAAIARSEIARRFLGKAIELHPAQVTADESLDGLQLLAFLGRNEGHGLSRRTGPTRAADPMHVVLRHVRQVEVHDLWQAIDVDTAGRDVGCHQHLHASALETLESASARVLALVAVDRFRIDAGTLELLRKPVGAVLRACEHKALVPIVLAHEVHECRGLARSSHGMNGLLHGLRGAVARRYIDLHRRVEHGSREGTDLRRKGRAEEQVLPALREQRKDATDIVNEAHIEHAVCFVEHQHLDGGKISGALTREVEQTSWRRDDDIHAACERLYLRLHADTAEDGDRPQRQVCSVGAHAVGDLSAEFTRRYDHESAYPPGTPAVVSHEPLQHGQREAGCLARAGLSRSHEIPPLQNGRNGAGLDRRGSVVALIGHGTDELGHQAEVLERRHVVS